MTTWEKIEKKNPIGSLCIERLTLQGNEVKGAVK